MALPIFVFALASCTSPSNGIDNASGELAETPTELDCPFPDRWVSGTDAIIFLEPAVSAEDIGRIAASLKVHRVVDQSRFVDQAQSFDEYERYNVEQDAPRAGVQPADIPTSFRVSFLEPDSLAYGELRTQYSGEPGVLSVVERFGDCVPSADAVQAKCTERQFREQVQVFLDPSVPEREIDRIQTLIDADETVEEVVYVDRAQGLDELKDLSSGFEDDATEGIDEDDIPPMFLVKGVMDADLTPLVETLRLDANVFAVQDDEDC